MPQLSSSQSRQFKGWVRPNQDGASRPVREEPGPRSQNHREIIEAGLANHPKVTTWGMLTNGMSLMGVRPTPANLTRVADLSQSDPAQFHELVRRARGNAVTAEDKERGARKRAGKALKQADKSTETSTVSSERMQGQKPQSPMFNNPGETSGGLTGSKRA